MYKYVFFLFIFLSFTMLYSVDKKIDYTLLTLHELTVLSIDNNPDAQFELGIRCAFGLGISKDMAASINLYRRAALNGHALAQYTLGNYYADGNVTPRDYSEAVKWWRLAANQGVTEAQYKLGVAYAKGYGVVADNVESVKWYKSASMKGHTLSQLLLGNKYYDGKGIVQSDERAYFWYLLSGALGNNGVYRAASANRQTVMQYLTEEQISYIQNEAALWYDQHH